MPSELTFDGIAAAGRAIVEAHKQKRGFEEGIRRLLSELYPDNAHFIYELLQNAEDAKASVVEFELRADGLEARHNGSRSFSLEDIDSIANIGDSTKKDDETQIGKFGVGFKAVYSYTTRPEIRSGEFSFAIADLFVPERIEGGAPDGWTTFLFPFDRSDKPAETARAEVERGLRELDEKTLLFLNTIREITYELPDGDIGFVKRTDVDDVTIRVEVSQGEDFVESSWLRLVGPASAEHDGQHPLTVAAAFKLEPKESGRSRSTAKASARADASLAIVPLPVGDVSIYFPAANETSNLRFHIHAPFASTVARDSVRDTSENVQLVADIGDLIVRNLKGFRDRGLIDDGFLAALPNADDNLKPMYGQVRSAILEAFNEHELTPVRGGGFGSARELVSSPGEIRRLLREPDLTVLFALTGVERTSAPRWIADRTGRAGKLLESLEPINFGWSELTRAFSVMQQRTTPTYVGGRLVYGPEPSQLAVFDEWVAAKSGAELVDLYQLLGMGRTTHRLSSSVRLGSIPMIRIRRRGKAEHVRASGGDVFLPAGRSDTVQSRVPVDLAYFDDEDDERANNLRSFYNTAGVARWNEKARMEEKLKEYGSGARSVPDTDAEVARHLEDIRSFARFAAGNMSVASDTFGNVPFLLTQDPEGALRWVEPSDTYIDVPFVTTGLAALYPWNLVTDDDEDELWWEEPEKHAPAGIYLDVEGIEDFLRAVGSGDGIEISTARVFANPKLKSEYWVNNRHSAYTVTRDWQVSGLAEIVATGDPTLLQTLWNTIVDSDQTIATAVYQANRSAGRYAFESQLAQQLTSIPWILDREGELKLPRQISLAELRDGWKHPSANSLVLKLGLGAEAAQLEQIEAAKPFHAEQLGIEVEDAELLKEAHAAGITSEDLRLFIAQRRSLEAYPDGASDDPDRRSAMVAHDAGSAPIHTTEIRDRSVVVGQGPSAEEAKDYLRALYTNADGNMHCQACHFVLPFKIKGEWYFEAIQYVGNRNRTHRQNALALCPLCAAKYRYKRDTTDEAMLNALSALEIEAGAGRIELSALVDGEVVRLWFTGKHALDLQAAMAVAGEERGED
jgi:hypothetical protein